MSRTKSDSPNLDQLFLFLVLRLFRVQEHCRTQHRDSKAYLQITNTLTALEAWHQSAGNLPGSEPDAARAILENISDPGLSTLVRDELIEAQSIAESLQTCLERNESFEAPLQSLENSKNRLMSLATLIRQSLGHAPANTTIVLPLHGHPRWRLFFQKVSGVANKITGKRKSRGIHGIEPKSPALAVEQPSSDDAQTNSMNEYQSARNHLNKRLDERRLRRETQSATFFPRFAARDVFRNNPVEVKQLYAHSRGNVDFQARQSKADVFYSRLLGMANATAYLSFDQDADEANDGFCNLLACLLWMEIPWKDGRWSLIDAIVDMTNGVPQIGDKHLPATFAHLKREIEPILRRSGILGPSIVESFMDAQWYFCPIVLVKNEIVCLTDPRQRFPFLEEPSACHSATKAQGATGNVYKVIVAKGHFQSRKNINIAPRALARKDFREDPRAQRAGSNEKHIQDKFILSSVVRHAHICHPLAYLETNERPKSIFFSLADGDLGRYMRDTERPETMQQKRQMFLQLIYLASALDYLHHGIQSSLHSRTSCHHLDLKPENILVNLSPSDGSVTLKITDFGFSTVHHWQSIGTGSTADGPRETSLRGAQSPSAIAESSPYLAPEALDDLAQVNSRSDVWALAAIVSTVMAWLGKGHDGVVGYAKRRKQHNPGRQDYFFSSFIADEESVAGFINSVMAPDGGASERMVHKLNPAVSDLFRDAGPLISECAGVDSNEEKAMYRKLWPVLHPLLETDPKNRKTRMDEVHKQLWDIENALQQEFPATTHT